MFDPTELSGNELQQVLNLFSTTIVAATACGMQPSRFKYHAARLRVFPYTLCGKELWLSSHIEEVQERHRYRT